jgi:hypothetical protein
MTASAVLKMFIFSLTDNCPGDHVWAQRRNEDCQFPTDIATGVVFLASQSARKNKSKMRWLRKIVLITSVGSKKCKKNNDLFCRLKEKKKE